MTDSVKRLLFVEDDKLFSVLKLLACLKALLRRVWGFCHDGHEHTANMHTNRLRGKIEIEIERRNPTRIVTVWGQGHKFGLPAGAAWRPNGCCRHGLHPAP